MKPAQASVVLAALILGPCVTNAQEQIVRLQCDGTVSFYDKNPPIRDVSVNGIYLEIGGHSIKVAGSMGWDGAYEIKRTDAASVFFVSSLNSDNFGSVNKYSGEFQLNRAQNAQLRESLKMLAMTRGVCRPAKPLF